MSEQLELGADGIMPKMPTRAAQAAFEAWNDKAKKYGWATSRVMLEPLSKKVAEAVRQLGGVPEWIALLEECGQKSPFLCGKVQTYGRKVFRFTLVWAVNPTNLQKVSDGNFWEAQAPGSAGTQGKAAGTRDPLAEDRAKLRNYRPGDKFWPAGWGPRPEQDGCRLAGEALADWREINKVTVQAPESMKESREERYAATVAGYRRVGRWDDANRVESALAGLQGRPAVLVPASDVAHLGMPPRDRPLSNPARPSSSRKSDVNFSAKKRGEVTDVNLEWSDDVPIDEYGEDS